MALNSFQKLTRVLPGMPFGTGADGAYSSATAPTMTKDSCSGTATSTTLTTTGSTFANGDILKIIQMRGTGVGQWEISRVTSGGGSTSLTLQTALQYTYTDSGASQAQAIKIPQYSNVTVQSGTWTAPSWDGNVGGVLTFACRAVLTETGTISANGTGFAGGAQYYCTSDNATAYKGEGTDGPSSRNDSNDRSANGNGGGPGRRGATGYGCGGGGGAGNGEAGTGGQSAGDREGAAGSAVGDANLQTMDIGGGGGGGVFDNTGGTGYGGNGGTGGGIITIYANKITTVTNIVSQGNDGQNWSGTAGNTGGGGGAGGSILICAGTVDIGTNKLSTIAGVGGTGRSYAGGAGGKGRIAVYYGSSLTGSVSSTYYGSLTSELDSSLIETGGGFLFNLV